MQWATFLPVSSIDVGLAAIQSHLSWKCTNDGQYPCTECTDVPQQQQAYVVFLKLGKMNESKK